MVVAGSYAYVTDFDRDLHIINVADPAVPTEVGFYDTPGSANGVAVAGNYAYVADADGGLRIINVVNAGTQAVAERFVEMCLIRPGQVACN